MTTTPPAPPGAVAEQSLAAAAALGARLREQLSRVIVGQHEVVEQVLRCLIAGGHVLLEGVPGLGKTVLVKSLAAALDVPFARVQCTPDLMPADILGTTVLTGVQAGEFQPGPVFTTILLADEVNRATPKTQAALLEAMAERAVTLGGVTRPLPDPFLVLATQNPIDMEGTYPLPEAQTDRFLAKVLVPLPPVDDLVAILTRTTGSEAADVTAVASAADIRAAHRLVRAVRMAEHVTRHAAALTAATHPDGPGAPDGVRQLVRQGASPRGAQSLVLLAKAAALLDGRPQASAADVRTAAHPALRHRLLLGYEAAAAGTSADDLVAEVLNTVGPPDPGVRGG